MLACRRPRQPPLADDGRDLRHGDPRARARQAARRQRRRLVLGAAGRRRAEGAGRRRRGRHARGRARSARLARRTCAPRWARRRSSSPRTEHDLDRVADLYVAAFEQAAGGGAVSDAVLRDVSQAAAEVGIEPGSAEAQRDRGPPRRGRARWLTASGPCPPGRALAGIVALSFAVRAWLARGMLGPFIMVDELIYSEMAKSFASDLRLRRPRRAGARLRRRLPDPDRARRTRSSTAIPDAYAAVKTINSLVMSLAAVPAYLIARRVVGKWSALLAALLDGRACRRWSTRRP